MSGPKIVDIRHLEAIRERQRRLIRRRLEQLQRQWREQRQRLETALVAIRSLLDAEEIAAIDRSIAAMDQRFMQLRDDQSLQEVEKHGTERLAFLDAEIQRLQHQINESVVEARQRARSMQAAINDLAARLRSAGMEEERCLLLMAPSTEALELAAQVLSRREQEQASQAMQQALADLGVSASSRQLQQEVSDPERERIEQLMVQLELLNDTAVTAGLRLRLEALEGELDPHQRKLRLNSLVLELSHALQRGQAMAEHHAILDELEAQLGLFEDVPAELLKAIAAQRESQGEGTSLTDLRQEVKRWCEQKARRLDGELIRSVVLGSLRELGYDVREGMQAGWVEGGSIVLQKAGSSDYAVELQDINGRLRSQVVRFGDPDSPVSDQQRQRDTEIEEQWCSAHAQTLATLRTKGMEAQIMAKREPGEEPLVVVRSTDTEHSNRTIIRTNQPSHQQNI